MRNVPAQVIQNTVADLCVKANTVLRPDVLRAIKASLALERPGLSKEVLSILVKNASIAKRESMAICQDTGMAEVFVEMGQDAHITGGSMTQALIKGVVQGYKKGYLRSSIVKDPILRAKPGYGPCVIHYNMVAGDRIDITVMPKGFGCENKNRIKMFKPTADISSIKRFIIDTIRDAGPDACPPYFVGIGMGGTQDKACILAKMALLERVTGNGIRGKGHIAKLESELLKEINKLDIGPMGLGGKSSVLAVKILTYPTHIAGLPVCVNISCHALRSARARI